MNNRVDQPPPWKKNFPVFRLIGGSVVSFIGDQIYFLALPFVVLSLTGSPLAMGIVAFLERLPILLQPLLGVLADRYHRKLLLIVCDIGRGTLIGLIGFLYVFDQLQMWQLYTGAFGMGVLSQLYNTAQFASIPALVREHDLEKANAVNGGLFQAAVLIGPGLGGIIVSMYHPGYALLINSLSFFLALAALLTLPIRPHASKRKNMWREMKEGFTHVYKIKPIFYTNIAMLISIFGTTLFLTMMVFHMKDTVGLSAASIGWLLSAGGASAICGAFLSPFLKKKWSYRQILFTASFLGGLSIIGFSLTHSYWSLLLMNAIGTLAASIQSPCIITIRQKLTPARLLGRVQATSRLISWLSMPVAALFSGVFSEAASTTFTILLGGILAAAASIFYLHPSLDLSSEKEAA
ncbi:MFS transporter [Halobacillus sp. Marseille-Q1614]|uniref:MFS transporter n=1 Tax=Halobacillus sp. Marseille-Q1614 TaxID=2709134 RepID=UPI0020C4E7F6|nr:MFS transporter [Halobacillus sp. Marseille-Q1614]